MVHRTTRSAVDNGWTRFGTASNPFPPTQKYTHDDSIRQLMDIFNRAHPHAQVKKNEHVIYRHDTSVFSTHEQPRTEKAIRGSTQKPPTKGLLKQGHLCF